MSKRAKLRKYWQRIRTEPKLGRNVAMFVVLLLLAGVAGGIILGHQGSGLTAWPWTNRFVFHAKFSDAQGVAAGQGQEVRIAGVTVGAIQAASVAKDGTADVELGIDPKYRVYSNAALVLRPKSPLNEMYVEVNPGDAQHGKPLAQGATLPLGNTRSPVTIDKVTQHLDRGTRTALGALINESDTALADAPRHLPGGLSATDKVVRDLQPVMSSLRTRKQEIAALVSELATISQAVGGNDQRLSDLAGNLQQTLRTVADKGGPLDSTLRRLPDFTDQLHQATQVVQELTGQLNPTLDDVRRASGKLPGALAGLSDTADRLGSVADKAKPVVQQAEPVVSDLRPVVGDVNAALPDLQQISSRLDPVTGSLVPYLQDLQAFVYNTGSATSVTDGDGGTLRGIGQVGPDTIPLLRTLGKPAK
ncbi:MlaD family protein [Sciscionella marina]|uniref:MlaD family protein n=1 Tax=Sciscionella marina TaxID=508770 RepID=UPI00037B4D70|nr:MlaD family protein [Sciscionella marina]